MGMWSNLRTELLRVRADNAVSITIRRGATTLDAQTVRIARLAQQAAVVGSNLESTLQRVVVMGDTDLDVEVGDRFTTGGDLYEVTAVRPNRLSAVVAEARLVS